MDSSLVQLITELVMAEMGKGQPAAVPTPTVAPGRKILLVGSPTSGEPDPLWSLLKSVQGVSWTVVRGGESCQRLAAASLGSASMRWVDPPAVWDSLVAEHEAVVLPVVRLEVLSRIALLLGDIPASAAALAAVMQGVPVLASAFEVDRLRRAQGRLPGPFISHFQQHVRTVEGMGISFLAAEALVARLEHKQQPVGPSRGRDVITVADLDAAAQAGQKVLVVTPGTIITPLAREKAAQMGIEVRMT